MISYTCSRIKNTRSCSHQTLNLREATMPVDIDFLDLPKYPQRLAEKLKQIRQRTGLTPEEFAPQVNAKDGKAVSRDYSPSPCTPD